MKINDTVLATYFNISRPTIAKYRKSKKRVEQLYYKILLETYIEENKA